MRYCISGKLCAVYQPLSLAVDIKDSLNDESSITIRLEKMLDAISEFDSGISRADMLKSFVADYAKRLSRPSSIRAVKDNLKISTRFVVSEFFDPVCELTASFVKKLLLSAEGQKVDIVVAAGGFAESSIFQDRLKNVRAIFCGCAISEAIPPVHPYPSFVFRSSQAVVAARASRPKSRSISFKLAPTPGMSIVRGAAISGGIVTARYLFIINSRRLVPRDQPSLLALSVPGYSLFPMASFLRKTSNHRKTSAAANVPAALTNTRGKTSRQS